MIHKLIRNTLSNTGAKILTLILSLVLTPLLIEQLGDEGYALLIFVPSIMGYFDLLGGGVPGGTVKFVAQYESRGDWATVNKIINSSLVFFTIIGVIAAIGMMALALFDGLSLFNVSPENMPEARQILMIAAGLALLSWPVSALNSTLEGVQEHHAKNIVLTSTTLLSMIFALIAALLGASILQVFIAQQSAYVMRWLWMTRVVKRLVPQWKPSLLGGDMATFKMVFGLSAWMLALQIASMLNYKFDELVLSTGIHIGILTAYNIVTRPFKLVQQASSMFNSAVMPAVSNFEARDGRAALDVFIYTGVRYNNLLVASLAITSTYFCAPFIALWVGERFLEWIWVAQVACAFQLVWQSNSTLGRVFYGTGKVERIALIALVSALLNAGLSILLVGPMGMNGVILATVIVGCLAVPAQYLFVFPLLDIPRLGYLKRSIIQAQWRHWMVGLALVPLWQPIQTIRSWWVLLASSLLMLTLFLGISWRFGIEPEHKRWVREALSKRFGGER